MALGGILSRGFIGAFKNVTNVLKPVRTPFSKFIKHSSTRNYREGHLEKINEYYAIANKDILDRLNTAEFNHFVSLLLGRKLDALDLREMFDALDENRDEYISMREIQEHLSKGLKDPALGDLKYAFCRFDKDFDNYIYLHEAREALFYLGFFQAGDKRIGNFFEKRDTNKDWRLSYEEFAEIVKKDMPSLF
ncbi:unnamed protein product [Nezara viridula]|uniref:EF-hand domain-containing protein n=1 Tax=Nezara viridula TaxID=85310 RepID=A0A9P0MPU8_NEZVI|nr:unnamed protein product [Nezara viridula]